MQTRVIAVIAFVLALNTLFLVIGLTFAQKAISAQTKGIVGAVQTHQYTDRQIAEAIYWAEGGPKASTPYGIKGRKYATKLQYQRCCEETVRNNRIRFAKNTNPRYQTYIDFLSSRYAPIGAGNDPQGLNKNWIRNVSYFLEHPKATV